MRTVCWSVLLQPMCAGQFDGAMGSGAEWGKSMLSTQKVSLVFTVSRDFQHSQVFSKSLKSTLDVCAGLHTSLCHGFVLGQVKDAVADGDRMSALPYVLGNFVYGNTQPLFNADDLARLSVLPLCTAQNPSISVMNMRGACVDAKGGGFVNRFLGRAAHS